MDFTTRNQIVAHSNTDPHKLTVQQMQDEIDLMCGADEEEEEKEEDQDEEIKNIQCS